MQEYPKDHHIWNPIAITFFLLLVGGIFFWLSRDQWFVSSLYSINTFDLFVLALATFRLIRLVTYDKIMQFFRNWFLNHGEKPEGGIRRLGAELLECIWCTGMWAALMVMLLYFSGVFGLFVVYLFAISALGTVFQSASQMILRVWQK